MTSRAFLWSECAEFPALDETMLLEAIPTTGVQGQTVEVMCSANMTTADGQTSQTVTCGPTGWTPAQLSSCNGQWSVVSGQWSVVSGR